jgi:hypothetical protein
MDKYAEKLLVEAVKRIIVPAGYGEVKIRVGEYLITIREDGTNDIRSVDQEDIPLAH